MLSGKLFEGSVIDSQCCPCGCMANDAATAITITTTVKVTDIHGVQQRADRQLGQTESFQ